jgi:hypothetical protein
MRTLKWVNLEFYVLVVTKYSEENHVKYVTMICSCGWDGKQSNTYRYLWWDILESHLKGRE